MHFEEQRKEWHTDNQPSWGRWVVCLLWNFSHSRERSQRDMTKCHSCMSGAKTVTSLKSSARSQLCCLPLPGHSTNWPCPTLNFSSTSLHGQRWAYTKQPCPAEILTNQVYCYVAGTELLCPALDYASPFTILNAPSHSTTAHQASQPQHIIVFVNLCQGQVAWAEQH